MKFTWSPRFFARFVVVGFVFSLTPAVRAYSEVRYEVGMYVHLTRDMHSAQQKFHILMPDNRAASIASHPNTLTSWDTPDLLPKVTERIDYRSQWSPEGRPNPSMQPEPKASYEDLYIIRDADDQEICKITFHTKISAASFIAKANAYSSTVEQISGRYDCKSDIHIDRPFIGSDTLYADIAMVTKKMPKVLSLCPSQGVDLVVDLKADAASYFAGFNIITADDSDTTGKKTIELFLKSEKPNRILNTTAFDSRSLCTGQYFEKSYVIIFNKQRDKDDGFCLVDFGGRINPDSSYSPPSYNTHTNPDNSNNPKYDCSVTSVHPSLDANDHKLYGSISINRRH